MAGFIEVFRTFPDEPELEECFRIGLRDGCLSPDQYRILQRICRSLPEHRVTSQSQLSGAVGEVGPRPAFETAQSTNSVDVLRGCGFGTVNRVELFTRHVIPLGQSRDGFLAGKFDPMTQCVYPEPITSFTSDAIPASVEVVDTNGRGIEALREINVRYGLGMPEQDLQYFYKFFLEDPAFGRNPTGVEVMHAAQASSDHSRHRTWNAKVIIDGQVMPYRLIDLVRVPYEKNPGNSVLGFADNASSMRVGEITWFIPARPGRPSHYVTIRVDIDGTCTVETHNHPTRICPWPGAGTGLGGCLRDSRAPGRGGMELFALAGFFTMDLCIPGYIMPWENPSVPLVAGGAQALQIMREAPMGTWDYGNKYGVPTLLGITFTAQFDNIDPLCRWGYAKPIMLAGLYGYMLHEHAYKLAAQAGMKIVQIGGKAFRVGLGGGTASSQGAGDISEELDYASVQRPDAEMGLLTRMVIDMCVRLLSRNPIVSIHDQGAAGPLNVLTELIEKLGGKIEIREIRVGDSSMTVLELWAAEYQERYGILVWADRLDDFIEVCEREGCPYEVLGEAVDTGRIQVTDRESEDFPMPVDLPIEALVAGLPQWTLEDTTPPFLARPLILPDDLTVMAILERILRLPAVASKEFQIARVDISVGGKVVQSQRCGPYGLPIADAAVSRFGFFDPISEVGSLGAQPLKLLLGGSAGVRMAIAEALLNAGGVRILNLVEGEKILDLPKIKIQGNVMWPGRKGGEIARLYEALENGVQRFLDELGFVEDGGKDSMSMTAKDIVGMLIKSLPTFVASLYTTAPDAQKVVTPDIKLAGESVLMHVDIGQGKARTGGSALAQVFNQLGEHCPDIDDVTYLRNAFVAMQHLIEEGVARSYHDCSDGGLMVTLLEMAFAGGCGLRASLPDNAEAISYLFAEEAGYVFECASEDAGAAQGILAANGVSASFAAFTTTDPVVVVKHRNTELLRADTLELRRIWEETSYQMTRIHSKEAAEAELNDPYYGRRPTYHIPFDVAPAASAALSGDSRPKVAILRAKGTNGHEEMGVFFHLAGFEAVDVHFSDLMTGKLESLDEFRGIAGPGGFADGDVFGAGRGLAFRIMLNERLRNAFAAFYERDDTFSLGVCNGCQWMSALGLVPFRDMDIPEERQPLFVRNTSRLFESRWVMVGVQESPAIMFRGMEGARLGVWTAHGEGRLHLPSREAEQGILAKRLAPLVYIAPDGLPTEQYPHNPNGSPHGITALCDESGQHVVMMPHPERVPNLDNWPYLTEEMKTLLTVSPWLKCVQNLYAWCMQTQ